MKNSEMHLYLDYEISTECASFGFYVFALFNSNLTSEISL